MPLYDLTKEEYEKELKSFQAVQDILGSCFLYLKECKTPVTTLGELCEKIYAEEGEYRANEVIDLFHNGINTDNGGVPLVKVQDERLIYTSMAHALLGVVLLNSENKIGVATLFSSLLDHLKLNHLVKSDVSQWVKAASRSGAQAHSTTQKTVTENQLLKIWREQAAGIVQNVRLLSADNAEEWVENRKEKIGQSLATVLREHLSGWMQNKQELVSMLRKVETADSDVSIDEIVLVLRFIVTS